MKKLFSILICALISVAKQQVLCDQESLGDPSPVALPARYKTEGKITWTIKYGSQRESKELYFIEIIDSKLKQSSVTIGESLSESTRYVVLDGIKTFQVKQGKGCIGYSSGNFVDSINHFANKMFSVDSQYRPQYQIGPTGFIKILLGLNGDKDLFADPVNTDYRNIPCIVYTTNVTLQEDVYASFRLYKPSSDPKNDIVNFIAFGANSTNLITNTNTSFIIQIYNFEDIQDAAKIKNEFNLPLAQGCSRLVSSHQPHKYTNLFQMQIKTSKPKDGEISIYFDGQRKLLRQDTQMDEFKQTLIWDIQSGLLFSKQFYENPIKGSTEVDSNNGDTECRILDIAKSDELPASMRPYAQSLDALGLLGAQQISFIGSSNLQGVPTLIYETLLEEPPFVFAMGKLEMEMVDAKEYLVQFHIMDTYGSSEIDHTSALNRFWPVRMALYARKQQDDHDNSNHDSFEDFSEFKLLKQYEIEEFRWNFDGTDLRPGQLFEAAECMKKLGDSKYKLEFDLFINECHLNPDEEHKNVLARQAARIEYQLLNQILEQSLEVSRMHMLNYQMQLLQTHLDFDLSLSELSDPGRVKLLGIGKWDTNVRRIAIHEPNEQNCIVRGSLGKRVRSVFFCLNTKRFMSSRYANCHLILDDDPDIKDKDPEDEDTCYAYGYQDNTDKRQDDNMKLGHLLESVQKMISQKPFELELLIGSSDSQKKERVQVKIIDYDVTYEMIPERVPSHAYNIENATNPDGIDSLFTRSLRAFKTIDIKMRQDCENLCHLDGNCHSYSYCKDIIDSRWQKCVLSSLDLVESKVNQQLALISPAQKQKVVHDVETNIYYDLFQADSCNLHEHNYLGIYRHTREFLHVKREKLSQFYTGRSAQECAHRLLHMQEKSQINPSGQVKPDHHLGMFAFCPLAQKCIFREDFINSSLAVDGTAQDNNNDPINYNSCHLYRKKYQTYFTISTKVLKLRPSDQVALEANNLEQCSRACWDRGSRACHSFDFCQESKTCMINKINSSLLSSYDFEVRQGCLHYAINPMYDSAEPGRGGSDAGADAEATNTSRKIGRFFLNSFIIISLTLLGTVGGLAIGIVWHRRLVRARINREARMQDERVYQNSSIASNYGTAPQAESTTSRISLKTILSRRNWPNSNNLSYQEFNSLSNSNYVNPNERGEEGAAENGSIRSVNNENVYENVAGSTDGIHMNVIAQNKGKQ